MPASDWSQWVVVDHLWTWEEDLQDVETEIVLDCETESWDTDTETLAQELFQQARTQREQRLEGRIPSAVDFRPRDTSPSTLDTDMVEIDQELEAASPMDTDTGTVSGAGEADKSHLSLRERQQSGAATVLHPDLSGLELLERNTIIRILLRNQLWNCRQI